MRDMETCVKACAARCCAATHKEMHACLAAVIAGRPDSKCAAACDMLYCIICVLCWQGQTQDKCRHEQSISNNLMQQQTYTPEFLQE